MCHLIPSFFIDIIYPVMQVTYNKSLPCASTVLSHVSEISFLPLGALGVEAETSVSSWHLILNQWSETNLEEPFGGGSWAIPGRWFHSTGGLPSPTLDPLSLQAGVLGSWRGMATSLSPGALITTHLLLWGMITCQDSFEPLASQRLSLPPPGHPAGSRRTAPLDVRSMKLLLPYVLVGCSRWVLGHFSPARPDNGTVMVRPAVGGEQWGSQELLEIVCHAGLLRLDWLRELFQTLRLHLELFMPWPSAGLPLCFSQIPVSTDPLEIAGLGLNPQVVTDRCTTASRIMVVWENGMIIILIGSISIIRNTYPSWLIKAWKKEFIGSYNWEV